MNKKLLAPVVAVAMIGAGGLSLIKSSEGLRYSTYRDPVGIPTVCYGHTGPEVRLGQRLDQAACDRILLEDIAKHQRALIGPTNCIASVPLTQGQLDGLTSFTFNVGISKFCGSTMAAKLRIHAYSAAADEFPKWAKARQNGKLVTLPGLLKRRLNEQALFRAASTRASENAPTRALRAVAGALY